ncbi:MAG TPA: RsmE family RNA methyltransferase [Actinomycetota bacterium]|nr:RsmE family RNA methyltransferase [Actinomycetota bacterium]
MAPHFFVDLLKGPDTTVSLSLEDSRHALRSLRLQPGEEISLADGTGTVGRGRLVGEGDGLAEIRVEEVRQVVRRPPIVSVALAPPKGDRLSWAVQKLAEIGVDEVVLIETGRTIRTWDQERADRAADRLRAVAREAAMQSRQPFVMEVNPAVPFQDAFPPRGAAGILLWAGAQARLAQVLPDEVSGVRLLVGPEGGFSQEEIDAAREAGMVDASLGSSILRTETAALAGAVLVLARYGRLG